jgi:hypothetical protein
MAEKTPEHGQFEASGHSEYPSNLKEAGFPEDMTGTVTESYAFKGGSAPGSCISEEGPLSAEAV